MNITIVTEEQIKIIDEYIKEQEFWKSSTGDTVKDTFIALIGYGMETQVAIKNISAMISAMSEECGD